MVIAVMQVILLLCYFVMWGKEEFVKGYDPKVPYDY